MRIFALETNHEKLKAELLLEGEQELMCAGYHWMKFFGTMISCGLMSIVVISILGTLWYLDAPYIFSVFPILIMSAVYLWFIGWPMISAFVDYMYDCVILTNSRIIIIDQASVIHRDIRKMDIENIASVRAKTQFLNMFPFGTLHFDLKEGVGKSLILKYIPNVDNVSSRISCCLRDYQNRSNPSPDPAHV